MYQMDLLKEVDYMLDLKEIFKTVVFGIVMVVMFTFTVAVL